VIVALGGLNDGPIVMERSCLAVKLARLVLVTVAKTKKQRTHKGDVGIIYAASKTNLGIVVDRCSGGCACGFVVERRLEISQRDRL
jgi:hypothetical protein